MSEQVEAQAAGPGYLLQQIEVIEYGYHDLDPPPANPKIQFGFNVSMKFNAAKDFTFMLCSVFVKGVATEEEIGTPQDVLSAHIRFQFHTVNLEPFVEGKIFTPPTDFMRSLINISLGTSRGILYSKNFGTKIGGVILPSFPTDKFLPPPFNMANLEEVAITAAV